MQPIMGLGSFDPYDLAADSLLYRVRQMAGDQRCWLAVRLTATTVDPVTGQAAAPCPVCWDADEQRPSVPNDATCLGTGFIVPASGNTPRQAGYLNPVPVAAFVLEDEDKTEQTEQGVVQYSQDTLYIVNGDSATKKGDVVIQVVFPSQVTERWVVGDTTSPHTLGGRVLMETPVLEHRAHTDSIYSIPLTDLSLPAEGSWEG